MFLKDERSSLFCLSIRDEAFFSEQCHSETIIVLPNKLARPPGSQFRPDVTKLFTVVIYKMSIIIFSHLATLQLVLSTDSKSPHPLHFHDHWVLWLKTPVLAPCTAPIRRPFGLCNKASLWCPYLF